AISNWERARRQVSISAGATPGSYRLQAPAALDQATLLCMVPDSQSVSLTLDGKQADTTVVERYGFRFVQAVTDLSGEHTLQVKMS
ncbi:MAG: hypothetical protein HY326_05925, partial [Chloroflexi bacterium]|nr:hypothetical protein [Chloroflexota bacterium]